ncbi:MAG: hypothetical protein ACREDF_09535 [Thermoplasmata archaeon]
MWRHIEVECYYCQKKLLPTSPGDRVCSGCSSRCPRCGDKSGKLVCGACIWAMDQDSLEKYPEIRTKYGSLFGANPDCVICSGNGYFPSGAGPLKLCECRKNELAVS